MAKPNPEESGEFSKTWVNQQLRKTLDRRLSPRRDDEIERLKLEETHRQNQWRRELIRHLFNTITTALVVYFFGPSGGGM